jgi:hypothetical protein
MLGYVEGIRKSIGHDTLILVGTGIYIYKDDKLLLQKRKDNGCWSDHLSFALNNKINLGCYY